MECKAINVLTITCTTYTETLLRCKSSSLFELYSKHVEWYHILQLSRQTARWCSQVTWIAQ